MGGRGLLVLGFAACACVLSCLVLSCLGTRGLKFLDLFPNELSRKHLPLIFSLIRNGCDQRRSGTFVVFTISHADSRLVSLAL